MGEQWKQLEKEGVSDVRNCTLDERGRKAMVNDYGHASGIGTYSRIGSTEITYAHLCVCLGPCSMHCLCAILIPFMGVDISAKCSAIHS